MLSGTFLIQFWKWLMCSTWMSEKCRNRWAEPCLCGEADCSAAFTDLDMCKWEDGIQKKKKKKEPGDPRFSSIFLSSSLAFSQRTEWAVGKKIPVMCEGLDVSMTSSVWSPLPWPSSAWFYHWICTYSTVWWYCHSTTTQYCTLSGGVQF